MSDSSGAELGKMIFHAVLQFHYPFSARIAMSCVTTGAVLPCAMTDLGIGNNLLPRGTDDIRI